MPTNNLLYNAFQVVSEFVYTDDIHNVTITYGNSVRLYSNSPNKASQEAAAHKGFGALAIACFRPLKAEVADLPHPLMILLQRQMVVDFFYFVFRVVINVQHRSFVTFTNFLDQG